LPPRGPPSTLGTRVLLTGGRKDSSSAGRISRRHRSAGGLRGCRPIACRAGLRTREDIDALVKAVAPKPVNVLVSTDFITVAELADSPCAEISIGGALARTAWTGFLAAAREIAGQGTFEHWGAESPRRT